MMSFFILFYFIFFLHVCQGIPSVLKTSSRIAFMHFFLPSIYLRRPRGPKAPKKKKKKSVSFFLLLRRDVRFFKFFIFFCYKKKKKKKAIDCITSSKSKKPFDTIDRLPTSLTKVYHTQIQNGILLTAGIEPASS